MLPKVVPLVEDLQRRVAAYRRRPTDPVAREIEALFREIAELGVEVKDPDRGLIDFRSERRGREFYLCWQIGEEAASRSGTTSRAVSPAGRSSRTSPRRRTNVRRLVA